MDPDDDGDGKVDDAFDSDENGIPDYLQPYINTNLNDDLIIYNAITPDGSSVLNAVFTIENIENYSDNTVVIFYRWGIKSMKPMVTIKMGMYLRERLQEIQDMEMGPE